MNATAPSVRRSNQELRARVLAVLNLDTAAKLALDRAAEEAWDSAWDAARDADSAAGRRYDRRMYAEAASAARRSVYLAAAERAGVAVEGRA
jgi:hypothetical protein